MATVDLSKLTAGLEGHAEIVVGEEHTAPRIGSGRVRVLATPVMINLMEAAALDAVENLIPAGHQSLGTHLDVRHIAATPVGMRVRATAKLLAVDGRTLEFRVDAHDEPVGELRRVFGLYAPLADYYYGRPGDPAAFGREEEWLGKQGIKSPIQDK